MDAPKPVTALEAEVLPVTKIVVKDGADQKEYKLVLDYNAIAKVQSHPELSKRRVAGKDGVEHEASRDLSQVLHWAGLTGPDLTLIAWAALDRFHPEVELRTLRQWLAPAQFDQLFVMLVEQCYPGVLERAQAAMESMQKKSTEEAPPTPETPSPS